METIGTENFITRTDIDLPLQPGPALRLDIDISAAQSIPLVVGISSGFAPTMSQVAASPLQLRMRGVGSASMSGQAAAAYWTHDVLDGLSESAAGGL